MRQTLEAPRTLDMYVRFCEEKVINKNEEAEVSRRESDIPAFSLWGMLSGLIQLAANKEEYIRQEMKLTKQEFLEHGFETLYRAVKR